MMNKLLPYLLLMLIASQSVLAAADIHQNHQSGEEHIEFQHDHDHDTLDVSHDENKADCDHCCHCHASFLKHFTSYSFMHSVPSSPLLFMSYESSLVAVPSSNLFRPPKA
jgi:hypothetical protein